MDTVPANGSLVTRSGRSGGLLSGFVTGLERMSQQRNSSVGKARALHDRAGAQASVTPPWSITLERSMMNNAQAFETHNQYIDFWNTVLVPKFNAWRHILAGGLHQHSAKVFPALPLQGADSILDVGCGWGDTAIELARRVQPGGSVVRVRLLQRVSRRRPRGCGGRWIDQCDVRRGGCSSLSVQASARFLLVIRADEHDRWRRVSDIS